MRDPVVMVSPDGWRIELVDVVLNLGEPARPRLRATWLGCYRGDYARVVDLAALVGDLGRFVELAAGDGRRRR